MEEGPQVSNNPPPNTIWLQWDGDAETPEPCTDDPDDRDVTWCRERVFNRDIQFERSDAITELKRDLEQERQDRKQADLDTLRALGERNDAKAEIEQIKATLANPHAVHLNMLRGAIQWTPAHLYHLLGQEPPNSPKTA